MGNKGTKVGYKETRRFDLAGARVALAFTGVSGGSQLSFLGAWDGDAGGPELNSCMHVYS